MKKMNKLNYKSKTNQASKIKKIEKFLNNNNILTS